MVQFLLEGLRADERFEVHHVNARVSDDVEDVGALRPQKFIRLFKFILQAWWIRLRHGRMAFYYVPAPAKRSAIMRDWVVMALCRPLFPELILHWHAYGLGEWTKKRGDCQSLFTQLALRKAKLSIVLTENNKSDADVFEPKKCVVVPNGIPDPCPDFVEKVLPLRMGRWSKSISSRAVRFLYMAQCTHAKGLFAALEAFALLKNVLASDQRVHLTVAGHFVDTNEEKLFWKRVSTWDFQQSDGGSAVDYIGFLGGEAKWCAFVCHDCLIVPSHWESFGLTVIEAAAYGMPAVISEQPNLLQLLPPTLVFSAPWQEPRKMAQAMLKASSFNKFIQLRRAFVQKYQSKLFKRNIGLEIFGQFK